jgi:ABC-type multidrug transport system ATPase subunit
MHGAPMQGAIVMTSPLLVLDRVSKRYWRGGRPIDVLKDVSLLLEPGEFAAVVADRGAGKSTLLEVAAGLQVPDSGRVLLDGRDLLETSALSQIAIATRQARDVHGVAVRDWVAMAVLDQLGLRAARRRANDVLQRVGLGQIGQAPWGELSDGERTLATIAHAVTRTPRLLLIDDLTAGLDLLERDVIKKLLRSLVDDLDMAILMTAAQPSQTVGARPILSLAGGTLVGGRRPRSSSPVVEFPKRHGLG